MIENVHELLLLSLASFRLTRLLVYDKITNFIRRPFHREVEEKLEDGTVETYIEIKGKGLRRFIGELLSCHWCTGVWSAAGLYTGYLFAPHFFTMIICILAIAGCASIIETVVQRIIDE
ncbi:DUF1360 domain-containing protein [Calidifontibacillus erzurumensis]|uniref:DUF1360 domain-containing protein n=1 Tax=Calidifontibacillus erzurumensis TaxID=2741433 RepID=A0A8J8GGN0_9BACI|nr:DUF1360 domain-containing protein [Calidifontibacillus erzurumensis]NSL51433.1 DUF1360 domain-containing protein [Calidifontibacillus erzurumensis]